ncbi:endoribonuclease Dcr-1-like [Sitodiplosis mosellana]|uniref:endoribonuclease Dcr-1-like n=1 Tax=Sitodiplosis mosellana TaxID=263140 RepID=UPI002443CF0E|nr:endoribonuclease Dcr-1-like [Sitodiplosis mosellana]
MLMIRRSYLTSRLPKLKLPLDDNTSIGKFLRQTKRSCPRRNQILGEEFCRFAIRLKVYTTADNHERSDKKRLHEMCQEVATKLDLIDPQPNESSHIKLPSTGQFLTESISRSLGKWKQNAHQEIWSLYKNTPQSSDDFIVERVRGINYSLIGWYLQTYGMQNALAFIDWLGVPLISDTGTYCWPQPKSPLLVENSVETQRRLNEILDGYDAIEKKLQYKFQDKAYLLQSVSHESFTTNELTPNYVGLDFVGDAITNYAITRHLFRQLQFLDATDLENACQLLYSNSCFATVSVRNEFHKFLRYTHPEIRNNINSFVAFLRANRFKPVNDLHFLDRKNFIFEVPPIIPGSFEALIAAVYFDSNMDINVVSNTLLNLMQWDLKVICGTKPKTAYVELEQLDPTATFSKPITMGPGKVQVTVTLPKYQNKRFNAVSRDPQLAKWGAAKTAVIQLKKQSNVFIPVTHNELYQHFKNKQQIGIKYNKVE